jgi:hypothetical protein
MKTMGKYQPSRNLILSVLSDGNPKSARDILRATNLTRSQVYNSLLLSWKRGLVLRTRKPYYEQERVFKGRAGVSKHTRPYHLYLLKPEDVDSVSLDGRQFVGFSEEHLDPRGGGKISKAQRVLSFLRENGGEAFFSKDVAAALEEHGVVVRDIMSNVRRFEKQRLVYVRGYKSDERQTPFTKGYLLTWLDGEKPREEAIGEAIQRTEAALEGQASSSPLMERVHRIRDIIFEHSKLRKLVSHTYLENKLDCSPYQVEHGVTRTLQLYPDLEGIKIFNNFRYYYHASLGKEDLQAAVSMKENYIRMTKGRANRVGHNWEAVAEWFIDRFTTGARFWTQDHRNGGMDRRRITLHLLKGVGGRRSAAEVDRVWEVTPGVFAPPITYVLSCKWGLVDKRHVDDFLDVLRWSKSFGVDTPDGRDVKQGVVGVFAASAFNPRDHVKLKDETSISLAQYAARRMLQLVTAADFNEKLRDRGCPKSVTVQKVCRRARDEDEVREALDKIWKKPEKSEDILVELQRSNEDIYKFEKMLESQVTPPQYTK